MRRFAGSPALTIIGLFTLALLVAPLAVVVAISFTSNALLQFPPEGFSLRWYRLMLERDEFIEACLTSLQLALASALASVLLGTTAAIGIRRHDFIGRGFLKTLLLSPLMLPQLVLAIALLMYLSRLGLSSSFIGLWLGHLVVTLPYVVRLVLVSLERVDPNIERAARIAGASPARVFFSVTIWLIMPGILAGGSFAFIMSFDNLVVSLFLTGPRITTLPAEIYGHLEYADDPLLTAVSSVVIVGIIAILVVMERTIGFTSSLARLER